jgi:hypothetical protein
MSSSCTSINMNPYWNYVATPYLFVVILFGMFVLFNLKPGYFASQAVVQAAAATVAASRYTAKDGKNAITALAGRGK